MKMSKVFKGQVLVDEGMVYTLKETFVLGAACKQNHVYACFYKHGFGVDSESSKAAAQAINMHDELIEALELLVDAINNPSPDAHEHVCAAEDKAVHILQKAKGHE